MLFFCTFKHYFLKVFNLDCFLLIITIFMILLFKFYSGIPIAFSGLFFLEFVSLCFMCVNGFITGLSFSFFDFLRKQKSD